MNHEYASARSTLDRDEPQSTAVQRAARPSALSGPTGLSARRQAADIRAAQGQALPTTANDTLAVAARGVAGGGEPLPHGQQIQAAFGRHDISGIRAHAGGPAREAATEIGARAYATGQRVAFAQSPDLHTAAHEAAHVVQQRGGVSLKGGVGQEGDAHERHADAVADAVVAGQSAEALLDGYAGAGQSTLGAVQRQAVEPPAPAGAQSAPEGSEGEAGRDLGALSESVLTAIAQKETKQKAVESRMETSAGVKASYASEVQATAGWTLTTLKKLSPEARKEFGLTLAEVNAAEKRAKAARQLWSTVMATGEATVDDVKKDPAVKTSLEASGLGDDDLKRMIAFRELRATMDETADAALAKAEEAKGKPLTAAEREKVYQEAGQTVAASESNQTLKMGHVSLRSHIRQTKEPGRSPMWREDMAAWQRKAVETGPKGEEIKKAATDDAGLELGRVRITEVVQDYLKANPDATDEEVVRHAAKQHNPGSGNYARDVVKIWQQQAEARRKAEEAARQPSEGAVESDAPPPTAAQPGGEPK